MITHQDQWSLLRASMEYFKKEWEEGRASSGRTFADDCRLEGAKIALAAALRLMDQLEAEIRQGAQ